MVWGAYGSYPLNIFIFSENCKARVMSLVRGVRSLQRFYYRENVKILS
jgi:hypothetical protein